MLGQPVIMSPCRPCTTGTARLYTEYLIYNMETDAEDKFQEIKNASAPYNKVGTLEVRSHTKYTNSPPRLRADLLYPL